MAATMEERMKILQMLQAGTITPQDASKLLDALDAPAPKTPSEPKKGRCLHIRVTDLATKKARVNVTLPAAMVRAGLKLGSRFAPELEGLDPELLRAFLVQGDAGVLVDVVDEKDGEHVEVYLE